MKIFIDICNAAKIMLLGKGSSLAVGHGRGFISIIKSSARVEYLGTALVLPYKLSQRGLGVRLNKFLNVYRSSWNIKNILTVVSLEIFHDFHRRLTTYFRHGYVDKVSKTSCTG